jgi:CRISPR/Cas system CMR-associated protein Cmr1 (group 7 of RAMP superfamily)
LGIFTKNPPEFATDSAGKTHMEDRVFLTGSTGRESRVSLSVAPGQEEERTKKKEGERSKKKSGAVRFYRLGRE